MTLMREAHELGTYDEALSEFRSAITDARREWAAGLLKVYPERRTLHEIAANARRALGSWAVEINAIQGGEQTTLAASPGEAGSVIRVEDSLCVLTVGADRPLAVSDIQKDAFTRDHATRMSRLGSWASFPIHIEGALAGSICALQDRPREWTVEEERVLLEASDRITEVVESWADGRD